MSFDIDEALNDIILKHGIDKFYPRFRPMLQARKAIKRLFENLKDGEKVACISIGEDSRKTSLDIAYFSENISPSKLSQLQFFSVIRNDFSLKEQYPNAYDYSQMENVYWRDYAYVYIISNYGSHILDKYLDDKSIVHTSLYDYLQEQEIYSFSASRDEWYDVFAHKIFVTARSPHDQLLVPALFEANRLLHKLNNEVGKSSELVLLQRLFFCALCLRNFLLAREAIGRILTISFSNKSNYQYTWDAVQLLLLNIKRAMCQRDGDIVNLWIDCCNYHQTREHKYLKSLEKNSVYFTDMITITGFTHESIRTIFLGKKILDDDTMSIKKIDESNSPVLKILAEKNYKTGILGDILYDLFEADKRVYTGCMMLPASMMLWMTIKYLLSVKGKAFCISHIFMETHTPLWAVTLNDRQVYGTYASRCKTSLIECDRQVEFYMRFLSKATTILFNDHGSDGWWPRQHVMFAIKGEGCRPRKIHGLCSNLDYYKIIGMLVENGDIKEEKLVRPYVPIQGTNLRNINIDSLKKMGYLVQASPSFQSYFKGYTGVVTENHFYIYMGGREFLGKRGEKIFRPRWFSCPEDICDVSLLPRFRKMAGTEKGMPMQMNESENYKILCHVYDKSKDFNRKKIVLANDFLRNLPGNLVIYGGDEGCLDFYYMLDKENRKKIRMFIDYPTCRCQEVGLPVMPLRELLTSQDEEAWVKAIVLPPSLNGFRMKNLFDKYEEVKAYLSDKVTISVIDMNKFLKEKNFSYGRSYWQYEIRLKDFQ